MGEVYAILAEQAIEKSFEIRQVCVQVELKARMARFSGLVRGGPVGDSEDADTGFDIDELGIDYDDFQPYPKDETEKPVSP